MTTVRQQLLREKAADLVVEHAIAVAPPEEPEVPVAATEPSAEEGEAPAAADAEPPTEDEAPEVEEAEQPADQ